MKYIPHTFSTTTTTETSSTMSSSSTMSTLTWLHDQLAQTLDNLTMVEMKLDSLETHHDQRNVQTNTNSNTSNSNTNSTNTNSNTKKDDHTKLMLSLEYLSLAHGYLTINNDNDNNDNKSNKNDIITIMNLNSMTKIQEKMVHLLLHHYNNNNIIISTKPSLSSTTKTIQKKYHQYNKLYQAIHQRYIQYYQHLHAKCILEIRKYIRETNFPSNTKNNLKELEYNTSTNTNIRSAIQTLIRIQSWNEMIENHIATTTNNDDNNSHNHTSSCSTPSSTELKTVSTSAIQLIIKEFMKPIIHRVQYHFIISNQQQQQQQQQQRYDDNNNQQLILMEEMKKRPEKLLEWICTYIQDLINQFNIIQLWDFIQSIINNIDIIISVDGKQTQLPLVHELFINEMNQLICYVLYKHNYWNHLKTCASATTGGSVGNPMIICHSIESMLKYDDFMKELLVDAVKSSNIHHNHNVVMKTMMDNFIMNNEDIFHWWLKCEHINSLHDLQRSNNHHDGDNNDKSQTLGLSILPYTEMFLSLLSSFERKISVMSIDDHRKSFIKEVEVPLCVSFMEGMHLNASNLRRELGGHGRGVINLDAFKINIQRWINVITGTTVSAQSLLSFSTTRNDKSMNVEKERIGSSLSKLANAMEEELSAAIVEDLFLERTKGASYLMQCAYTLSLDKIDQYHNYFSKEISSELFEGYQLIKAFSEVCIDKMKHDNVINNGNNNNLSQIPIDLMKNVARRIEDAFLEVALDYNGMVPELSYMGCRIFSLDISFIGNLFHLDELKSPDFPFSRLLDLSRLMAMDITKFETLRDAMRDLLSSPLDLISRNNNEVVIDTEVLAQLDDDGTLFNEAQSMIVAQGFNSLTLDDVVNILNRRITIVQRNTEQI